MASRHHYSIPGASLLKTRGSSKAQTQKTAAGSGNVPSSSRDTRQPSSSRAYYTQDTVPRNAPPSRPPSASGYRTQQPNASVNGFQASSNTRPPPAQRPAMTPQASSSRTRLDVPDPRSYFSKMFSRKQTPVGAQGEEKHKSSHKHQRSSQAYPAAYAPTAAAYAPIAAAQAPAPPAGPSAGWTAYDADASLRARESEREDRARQKTKEDPVRAERMKVERMHSEYAVYKAKLEETEQAQAAAAAKATRMDRTASRPSREERRQQEYESDNARRRLQAQQVASSSARKQEARQSHYLHPAQLPTTIPSRATAPARDALQTPAPQTATRPPGVPVQPSTSSQSTSASHQAQALHSAPPLTRTEPIITSAPTPAPALIPASVPAPPPKVSSTPYQSSNYTLSQNPPRQTEALPSAPNMLPPYQPSGPDERNRLDREAAEREALLSREREHERERERESERCREAREAAEREALASREREHERELERRRESDKEAAEREVLQHRERERERELERERRRARRAERERKKELENAERERRKELESAERERQKELERAERERLRALEQFELEKQREAERLQRERKEYERAEKERLKAERERQRDAERIERERLREKAERERERAIRTSSKHRSHRDKTQSMPTNPPPGAASGSDTDRTGRKDGRHRSQSHPPVVASEAQPLVSPFGIRRPESRKDTVPAPVPGTVQSSAPKPDNIFSHHDPAQLVPESPMALPIPPPHVERRDQVIYPRRMSTVPSATQTQGLMPPKMPERSHTDTLLSRDPPVGGMQASAATMQLPEPLPVALQSKLVSIYASQGPPDRTPYRATQKAPSLSTAEQRAPGPTPTLPTATNEYEGRPRSSLDHSSYRPSTIPANTATPVIPAATSTSAPQVQPQLEPSTATQAPSATSLRHFMMSTQPPSNDMYTATSITPMLKPPSRPDTGFVPSHGKALPSPDIHVPLSSAQSAHQTNSTATQQPVDDRLASVKPAVVTSHGAGFSSYSQSVLGSTKEPSRASAQDQQLNTMSRAPSNNSTRSPSRKAALLPTETASGAFSTIPVSRTASDASQSTETGEHRQLSASYSQSQPHVTSLQHLQPTSATPMYFSAQNASLTSRVPHESVTNLHQQSVIPTHSHSQSLPQQTSSSNPYNSSDVENGFSRYDNLSNGRTAAPLSATNTIPDGSHQQYPSIQQSSSQSKANYNSSSNAYLPVQSQQSHPMLSSSTQDNNSHLWTPMLTNNMSPYSAVVASPNPLSQTPSTMFSQPPVHPSNSSMYHNPSTSRIHAPTYQAHQQQQAAGITKPPLPQQNSSQLPTAAVKSSGPPTGPTNPSVYVTSTRQSGPFVDDTPSSIGIGLSLDSPPASRPPLQQPLQPTDRSTPQPAYIRSQAASGLSSTPMHSASQAQVHAQTQKAETPQDMDSPPPLTPSSSSRESHEEILMTPASLDPARAQVNVHQPPDSSQRSEKKKGGLFGLFRSSSTRSTKEKEVRDRAEPRGYESRRQVPGPSHDQRSESVNRLRSTRPPSIVITAESDSNPTNTGSVSMNHQVKQSRASRRAPPPIAIPQQSIPYRLFASKSKRYRTMSSASMEALDGTANNTVVGSPTSSRRSPTPSGPMTPPVRDPIEAAQVWRSNEDVFLDRGSHRRRRPGVTFDLKGDDVQKDGALYRHQSSRLHRQRKDPPR